MYYVKGLAFEYDALRGVDACSEENEANDGVSHDNLHLLAPRYEYPPNATTLLPALHTFNSDNNPSLLRNPYWHSLCSSPY